MLSKLGLPQSSRTLTADPRRSTAPPAAFSNFATSTNSLKEKRSSAYATINNGRLSTSLPTRLEPSSPLVEMKSRSSDPTVPRLSLDLVSDRQRSTPQRSKSARNVNDSRDSMSTLSKPMTIPTQSPSTPRHHRRSSSGASLPSFQLDKLRQLFDTFDTNQSGELEIAEIVQLLRNSYAVTDYDVETMLRSLDVLHDALTFQDFKALIVQQCTAPAYYGVDPLNPQDIARRFKHIDSAEGKGYLFTQTQLKKCFKLLIPITRPMAQVILNNHSNSGKGLNFMEFVELVQQMNGRVDKVWSYPELQQCRAAMFGRDLSSGQYHILT